MKSGRFLILLTMIVCGGAVVNAWQYIGEAKIERKQLREFPKTVGSWEQTGVDEELNKETLAVLRASDYLLRDYRKTDGKVMGFYVGYYASQRDGSTYHSPLNCLPGSGWVMSQPGTITISPSGRAPFVANRYIIENGGHRELLLYWYQGRGRSVASEYWGKVYTVLDSLSLRRSDGALVRITGPVGKSESESLKAAVDLAAEVSTRLGEFVPD